MHDDALTIARRIKLHTLKRDLWACAINSRNDVFAAQRAG